MVKPKKSDVMSLDEIKSHYEKLAMDSIIGPEKKLPQGSTIESRKHGQELRLMWKEFSFKATKKVPSMKQLQTIAESTPIHPAYIMDQVGQYRNIWHESILYLAVWGEWEPAGYRELYLRFPTGIESDKGQIAF